MIRYPLYVTIDTNIFDSTGYDLGDDGTLGHLCSYVQSGKIKIVLPLLKINMVLGKNLFFRTAVMLHSRKVVLHQKRQRNKLVQGL